MKKKIVYIEVSEKANTSSHHIAKPIVNGSVPLPLTKIKIMTPKEKAQEIFDSMCQTISSECEHDSYCDRKECKWKGITFCVVSQNEAKQCALIAAKNIADECNKFFGAISQNRVNYWCAVKAEIEKM